MAKTCIISRLILDNHHIHQKYNQVSSIKVTQLLKDSIFHKHFLYLFEEKNKFIENLVTEVQ